MLTVILRYRVRGRTEPQTRGCSECSMFLRCMHCSLGQVKRYHMPSDIEYPFLKKIKIFLEAFDMVTNDRRKKYMSDKRKLSVDVQRDIYDMFKQRVENENKTTREVVEMLLYKYATQENT